MQKIRFLPLMILLLSMTGLQAGADAWLLDYEKAVTKAKTEEKIILINFHGSDWCPPCMKLKDEVLSTDSFKELAESELVLVDADFPRRTKLPAGQREHNEKLARQFGVEAFPTVVLLDSEGKVLDKMVGYPRGGLDGFLSFIKAKSGPKS